MEIPTRPHGVLGRSDLVLWRREIRYSSRERDGSIGYSFTVHDFPFRSPVRMVIFFTPRSTAMMKSKQNRFSTHGSFFGAAEFYDELAVEQFLDDGGYGCFCQMQHFRQICAGKRRMVGDCLENQGAVHVSYIFLISGTHKKSSILPHWLYINLNINEREMTGKIGDGQYE